MIPKSASNNPPVEYNPMVNINMKRIVLLKKHNPDYKHLFDLTEYEKAFFKTFADQIIKKR